MVNTKVTSLVSIITFVFIFFFFFIELSESQKLAPALYIFGDSNVDVGNNNKLDISAKTNYLPYGMDFPGATPGRPTNGYNIADFFAEALGLSLPPPFNSINISSYTNTEGLNYASSMSGILDDTGTAMFPGITTLRGQIEMFKKTVREQLRKVLKKKNGEEVKRHLSKSIVLVVSGVNDFALNLLRNERMDRRSIDHDAFSQDLVQKYAHLLMRMYNLGARKFVVFDVEALGCLPFVVDMAFPAKPRCVDELNSLVFNFNQMLYKKISQLGNTTMSEATFVVAKNYHYYLNLAQNPAKFGLKEGFKPCCGVNKYGTCDRLQKTCRDRKDYVFFDGFHLTQQAYKVLATQCFNATSSDAACVPINLQNLAKL
ncbi:GDSL esterase/lipase 7-like [Cannabis sativa]|uniref:GDSL esterase/lipase 7-like n=1 Tax=Cannabis sativa TaxID=3483 RepID=UPI0029C9DABB|nr:GDSL esterase/lipase 7-like [Cannabis sativa]